MSHIDDWIWLHIPCPVEGCKNNDVTYWTHRNCPFSSKDHDVKINSAGYLKFHINLINLFDLKTLQKQPPIVFQ